MKIYFPLLVVILFACNRPSETSDQWIYKAEDIAWDAPDSALAMLLKVDTLQLDNRQYANYSLIRIQARNKAGYDISGEEKIFELKKYFAKGADADKAAKAAFYAGRIYQMRGDNTNAAQAYLDALRYEEKFEDRQLKGLIHINLGILNYEQQHFEDAARELKKSLNYFNPGTHYVSLALNKIGNLFFIRQQPDSALTYYKKALVSARIGNNTIILSNILQDMGVLYEDAKNYPEAQNHYRQAIPLIEEHERAIPYLNLGWMYFHNHQIDSAGFFADKSHHLLQSKGDLYSLVSVYELLYRIDKEKGDYRNALNWHEQYADSLFVAKEKQADLSILELQKQFHTDMLENKIHNKNLTIALMAVGVLLVLVIAVTWMYRRNNRKEKEMEDAGRKITTLQELADSFDEKECTYRNIVLQHFEILKKAAVVEAKLDSEEKKNRKMLTLFNQAVYENDEFDWNKMFHSFNMLENGYPNKVRQLFNAHPELDDTDFRVWCFSYAGFSQEEIVLLLKLNLRNIQARITRIREMFGIEKRGNIHQFLKEKVDCPKVDNFPILQDRIYRIYMI